MMRMGRSHRSRNSELKWGQRHPSPQDVPLGLLAPPPQTVISLPGSDASGSSGLGWCYLQSWGLGEPAVHAPWGRGGQAVRPLVATGRKESASCSAEIWELGLVLKLRLSCSCPCRLVAKPYPTLCEPMYCSPPGSSVHGILQSRILEWVAISSSRKSFSTQGSKPHLPCLLHW